MQKNLLPILIFLLISNFLSVLPAQSNEVFLQSTPIFIGEKEFTTKIDKVRVSREPLALVLSGGSARAYAHIGVLRQLEKADIKPDFIVANSMGAIIGLLYASGFSADDIEYIITTVDLNTFFDIVMPLKGGLLSARYFKEALSRLYPERKFDITDSVIPIIVPVEDLISKRQIWFAQGDITKIMTAAFAMSFMMEPVEYVLEDGTVTKLIDSGTIDLGSLSIARTFTSNIILSTALYEPSINLNNPVVVLNRSFSIGKERFLIADYLKMKPYLIRNDVEDFSFMDFAKVTEIIKRGDESTIKFLMSESVIEHDSFSNIDEFDALRLLRHNSALSFCTQIQKGIYPYSQSPVFGVKIRPNLSVIDNPLFLLSEKFSLGAYGFFDYKNFFIRTGMHSNVISHYGADIFARFRTSYGLQVQSSVSYDVPYHDITQGNFYAGLLTSWRIPLIKRSFFTPYAEAEMIGNEVCYPDLLFSRTGVSFDLLEGSSFSFSFNPYYFAQTENMQTIYHGLGLQSFADFHPAPFLGFKLSESFRITPGQKGTIMLPSDNYRGIVSASFSDESSGLVSISQAEVYWYSKNTRLTVMEAFKLEKLKAGIYGDFLCSYSESENNQIKYAYTLGLFTRGTISLSGLASFTLEAGIGWDFNAQKIDASLAFTQFW